MASSPDWARFGLDPSQKQEQKKQQEEQYHRCHEELFAQEEESGPTQPSPWWQIRPWFSRGGGLSWWDGAMATAALSTLGALVWVRGGWAVGTVGLSGALGVMVLCLVLGAAAVFSASALLVRLLRTADASDYYGSSSATGGAVYSLLSHSLGPTAAAAPAMLYCLAHVASCALHLRLFAEASTDVVLASSTSAQTREWVEKGVAIVSLTIVALANMAGVRRVAQLQLALLALLVLALLDLLIGAGRHWKAGNLKNNWRADYFMEEEDDSSFLDRWKNVFRVLFPALGGAVAAANLGADLRRPQRDVPLGAMVASGVAAVVASTLFLALAASSTRTQLLHDPLVAAHVSALGVVFLSGVYLSSLSSGLTALLAAPRVLQAVAAEDLLRPLRPLAKSRGSSQVPVMALCLTTMVALSLILVGGVADLAPVATLAMLLSQAALHLAYFLLASAENGDGFPDDDDLLTPSMAAAVTPSSSSLLSSPDDHSSIQDPSEMHALLAPPTTATSSTTASSYEPCQHKQRSHCTWRLWNRWLALLAGLVKVSLAMVAQWVLALSLLLGALVLWLVLRALAPASRPGAAALALKRRHQFYPTSASSNKSLLRSAAAALLGRASDPQGGHHIDTVLLTSAPPEPQVAPPQVVTRENQDFASRKPFHRAALLQH